MAFHKSSYNTDKDTAKVATVYPIRDKNDLKRIYDWFIENDLEKYAVLFKFGCYTGLRASDILAFKVKDLYKVDEIVIREIKTGKVKKFPLNPFLKPILNSYIERHKLVNKPDTALFAGRGDNEVDRSQVYRLINKACNALDIKQNVGTHTMRKTFGYFHYRQFHDIAVLQTIYNHASPDVTLRYIGITQEEVDNTYVTLDLEHDTDSLEAIALLGALKGGNRTRIRAVVNFCVNYIKAATEKGLHTPFAKMILDIIRNTGEYKYETKKRKPKDYTIYGSTGSSGSTIDSKCVTLESNEDTLLSDEDIRACKDVIWD